MTPTLVFLTYFRNSRAHKIMAAAAVADVPLATRCFEPPVDEAFKKNSSPLGCVPVLETTDGTIFESNAILRYVARENPTSGLYGSTNYESGMVDAWLDFCCTEIDPLTDHVSINAAFGKPLPDSFLSSTEPVLAALDSRLEGRDFLVGNRLTIADIGIAFGLHSFYRMCVHATDFAEKYKNCYRLYLSVMSVPKIAEVLHAVGSGIGVVSGEQKAIDDAKSKAFATEYMAKVAAAKKL